MSLENTNGQRLNGIDVGMKKIEENSDGIDEIHLNTSSTVTSVTKIKFYSNKSDQKRGR